MAVLPRETSAPQRHASPTLYLRQAASNNNSTTALPSVSAALASPTSQPPLSVDSPFSPQEGGNAAHGTAAGPRQAQMAIGVAVGIILLLLIGVTIALCCRFRRRRRHASSSNNRSGHDPAGSEEDIAEKDPNHTQQTPDRRLRGLALVAKVNGNNNSSSGDGMWTTMAGGDVAAPQRVKGENNTSPQRQQQQQQRYGSGDYEHWFSRHQDRRQKIYHAVSRLGGDEVKDGSDGRGNGAGWEKINTYAK